MRLKGVHQECEKHISNVSLMCFLMHAKQITYADESLMCFHILEELDPRKQQPTGQHHNSLFACDACLVRLLFLDTTPDIVPECLVHYCTRNASIQFRTNYSAFR